MTELPWFTELLLGSIPDWVCTDVWCSYNIILDPTVLCRNLVLVSEPRVPNNSSQSAALAQALNWDCEGMLGLPLPPIDSQTQRRERERERERETERTSCTRAGNKHPAALRQVTKILHDPKWSCRNFSNRQYPASQDATTKSVCDAALRA